VKSRRVKVVMMAVLAMAFIAGGVFLSAGPAAADPGYQSLRVPVVADGEVSELGEVLARFSPGQLQRGDTVILGLPSGFIWTTAPVGSDEAVASAHVQESSQWGTVSYTDSFVMYGDLNANYIKVPRQYSGKANGLFREGVPMLRVEKASDNEVLVEITGDPLGDEECFFYVYLNRIYVKSGYRGNITLKIEAPSGSGFAPATVASGQAFGRGTHPDNKIYCRDVPKVYAGDTSQKIGTIVIKEAVAGSIFEGRTLTLQLPAGAKWTKIGSFESAGLKIEAVSTDKDKGRTAEFKFVGASEQPAVLELSGLEVYLEPCFPGGYLKISVGGTAGFSGELTVANVIEPTVEFILNQVAFWVNGSKREIDVSPYLRGGDIYLPIRYLLEFLGVGKEDIKWDEDTQSVEFKLMGNYIKFKIGDNRVFVNDMAKTMKTRPELIEPGRTMLPLDWVSEVLGLAASWDSAAQKVVIKRKPCSS